VSARQPPVVIIDAGHIEDVDYEKLQKFVMDEGPLPEHCHVEDFQTYLARNRAADCDCGLIECVCAQARLHTKGCRFRLAMTCAVAIECDHGFDVCPECDPCTCPNEEKL
jgi:hypothetical protein